MSGQTFKARVITTFSSKGRRPAQEDHLLIDREKGIFVVADGFGGALPGAAAAQVACESVRSFLFKEAGDLEATLPFILRTYFSLAGNVLFNSLIHANKNVLTLNKGKNVHEKGGASVIAGFLDGDLLALAHVGLCTGWMCRDGKLVELVHPRSFGRLVNPFQEIVPEEHRVPLISLGTAEDLEPEIVEHRVRPGDWIILNTDGIERGILHEMALIQQRKLGPEEASSAVQSLLNQKTYQDNASLALVVI